MARSVDDNLICRNRRARHRFEVLEQFECGIVLQGTEVKSLRQRAVSLEESHARIEGGELWLVGCHIAPYSHGTSANHEPLRRRKLLVHSRQIAKLTPKVELKGFSLVPLRLYFNDRGIAKVSLALARGKSQADKRETLKKRDDRREIERAMNRRR